MKVHFQNPNLRPAYINHLRFHWHLLRFKKLFLNPVSHVTIDPDSVHRSNSIVSHTDPPFHTLLLSRYRKTVKEFKD